MAVNRLCFFENRIQKKQFLDCFLILNSTFIISQISNKNPDNSYKVIGIFYFLM